MSSNSGAVSGYKISANKEDLDLDSIHAFITNTYWAAGIPEALLKKAVDNSLCFGVFTDAGEQAGFARLVTDFATFAYLADVYIVEKHRGKGLCKWLLQHIFQRPDVQGMRRINLATRDAHGLYQKFGFTELEHPARMMEITRPDIYTPR